jgi:uncharacterized membrane protein
MSVTSSIRTGNADREATSVGRQAGRRRQPNLTTRPNKYGGRNEAAHVNVGDAERVLSALGGGALAVYGLSRGSLGGLLMAGVGGALVYRGLAGHCSMYCALGISTADERGPMTSVPAGSGCKVQKSVTINRPAEDLFLFWRNFENLPNFMSHLESVKMIDGRRSRWVAKAPLGLSVEWEAEVHTARPNELIGWRSLPGSMVDTAGSVHFVPNQGGRTTEVRVELKYNPPAGRVGAAVARWLGESPEQQIENDLNEFKRLMDAGEGANRGQPSVR